MSSTPDTLTQNQHKIRDTIRRLCEQDEPFATAVEIAEEAGFSKQTVLDNAETVVETTSDISVTRVGQANVYYINKDRTEEIRTDETENVVKIGTNRGEAAYAEIRKPKDDDSMFDYEVLWYDGAARRISPYYPEAAEIGEVAEEYSGTAVRIRY